MLLGTSIMAIYLVGRMSALQRTKEKILFLVTAS